MLDLLLKPWWRIITIFLWHYHFNFVSWWCWTCRLRPWWRPSTRGRPRATCWTPTPWTWNRLHSLLIPYKKDKDRREGKPLRCCLGGRIDSFLCPASYFAPGRFEDLDELHQDDMNNRMHCARSLWRIGWIHPFLQIILVQARQWTMLSLKKQRRHSPSVLYLSFYGSYVRVHMQFMHICIR